MYKRLNSLYNLLTLDVSEEAMKIMNRNIEKYKTKPYMKINFMIDITGKKIVMKSMTTVAEPKANQNNNKIIDQNIVLYSLISEKIESNIWIICFISINLFLSIICEI